MICNFIILIIIYDKNLASYGLLYIDKNTYENSDFSLNICNSKFLNNGGRKEKYFDNNETKVVDEGGPIINISDSGKSVNLNFLIILLMSIIN